MIDTQTFILRSLLAVALGALVGMDREFKKKPLGARAYMLICVGSAVLCMMSYNMATNMPKDIAMFDPSKIIASIVGGIGFLGAGAIMTTTEDGKLRGVGSGAAIWVVGIIGIGVGFGFLFEATTLAIISFLILILVGWARGDDKDD